MKSKAGRRTASAGRPGLCASAWGGELEKRENNFAGAGVEPAVCGVAYETTEPPLLYPRAGRAKLCGGEIRTRIHSFTRRALLSVELRRKKLVEWERVELSPNSLQDCRSAELSYHPEN